MMHWISISCFLFFFHPSDSQEELKIASYNLLSNAKDFNYKNRGFNNHQDEKIEFYVTSLCLEAAPDVITCLNEQLALSLQKTTSQVLFLINASKLYIHEQAEQDYIFPFIVSRRNQSIEYCLRDGLTLLSGQNIIKDKMKDFCAQMGANEEFRGYKCVSDPTWCGPDPCGVRDNNNFTTDNESLQYAYNALLLYMHEKTRQLRALVLRDALLEYYTDEVNNSPVQYEGQIRPMTKKAGKMAKILSELMTHNKKMDYSTVSYMSVVGTVDDYWFPVVSTIEYDKCVVEYCAMELVGHDDSAFKNMVHHAFGNKDKISLSFIKNPAWCNFNFVPSTYGNVVPQTLSIHYSYAALQNYVKTAEDTTVSEIGESSGSGKQT